MSGNDELDFGAGYNSSNSIAIVWCIDDVRHQLETLNEDEEINLKLTDDECMEVLGRVENNHEACYGVTWENIYNAIEYCFQDEIAEAKAKKNLKEEE